MIKNLFCAGKIKLFIASFLVLLVLTGCKKSNNADLSGVLNNNSVVQSEAQSTKKITEADANVQEITTAIKKEETNEPPIMGNTKNLLLQDAIKEVDQIEEIKNKDTNQTQYYKVIKVVDGDTIAVDIDGISETIRLIGINTPETKDPRKPVECFGMEASKKAGELLAGQIVELEKDETQDERDKYGRLLRYVKRKDGLFYNLEIIKQGYAYEYTYNIPYKYQKEFKEEENHARENKLGLWADGACGMANINNNASVPDATPSQYTNSESEPKSTECECSSNKYNCTDFKTHAEAQVLYDCCGGIENDIHKLDIDKDGEACESLP